MLGALLAAVGSDGVHWHGVLTKVAIPAVLAPLAAFLLAVVVIVVIYKIVGGRRPGPVNRSFRFGQLLSSSALSLAHGSNDAQKTMGIIGVALVAHGSLSPHHFAVPLWVVLSAAAAMGFGTYAGGWRIIRTVGSRIIKMDTAQGFSAQGAGAAVILVASHFGYPLSSTQVITAAVTGTGAGKGRTAVRWGVASNILAGWVLTLPVAAALGAGAYELTNPFGTGVLGPIVTVGLALVAALFSAPVRRLVAARSPAEIPASA
jgi:PiT family inorganic phosphate transporter